tara:strand:- start:221 stop:436 length:216 start_codon:yes stop_codon:yes gene_type:complete
MSINELIATSSVHAFNSGVLSGKDLMRKQLIEMLLTYLDLTNEPNEDGNYAEEPEWDRGFQAAIALIEEQK